MSYQPREDSYLLEEQVIKFSKGKKVLDVGSGSGIQAEAALLSGAKSVLAVDIDNKSVKNIKKKGIKAIISDLFSNVKGKFDLIIFNPPYLPYEEKEDLESSRQTAGGKRGDEIILRFFRDAGKHLNYKGIILIVLSSLTPKERILKILKEEKLVREVLGEKKFFMEKLEVWKTEKTGLNTGKTLNIDEKIIDMEENISLGLMKYEKDFLSFQKELSKLRETKPNQFVAFKDGNVISAGSSIEEIKKDLNSKGIEPSGIVIEFVSKEEIKVIV